MTYVGSRFAAAAASASAAAYSPSKYRAPLRLHSAADIVGSAASASVYAVTASAYRFALKRSLPRDLASSAVPAAFVSVVALTSSAASSSPSSSTMATRRIPFRSTLSTTARRARSRSLCTSLFAGSIAAAAVRSSSARASEPASPISKSAAPRRMSALKNFGSRSSAHVQSAMASCHRPCFIRAAALLLCTAGESGSSFNDSV